jgi:hypothetical protein
MRKSRTVSISLVSSLASAAMAAGCGFAERQQQGWQTCVDRAQGTAVENRFCDDEQSRQRPAGYVPHYGWYYHPSGYYWDAPRVGSPVPPGGTYGARAFDAPMARTGPSTGFLHGGSALRGGFGSTAAGHGGTGS